MSDAQYQSLVTVVVDGQPWGTFQTADGGDGSGTISKYRPGGTPKQKARKGQVDYADLTVTREWERPRDPALYRAGRKRLARADVIVTVQPLDENYAPVDQPDIYTGVLAGINNGTADANSDDGKMLTLVVTVVDVS